MKNTHKLYTDVIAKSGSKNEPLEVTENGTYEAPKGTGYSPVKVNVKFEGNPLQYIIDNQGGDGVPSCQNLFYNYKGTSLDNVLSTIDTSNVTNMEYMFYSCSKLTSIPQLDTSSATNMQYMFYSCSKLTTIPQLDTSNVTSMSYMFSDCSKLTSITQLDTSSATNMNGMFYNCKILEYVKLLNVKIDLQIGSGTSWGHLIQKDCLIQIISELIKPSSGTKKLTIGTANLSKLADTYVKLLEDDGSGKYPFEVCDSTDEGAMLISDYCIYKSWNLA